AVLEEGPEARALGLPAVGVQVQGPEPLGGEDRLVHLQLPPPRLEVEGTHGPRLLHLMVRIEILEEHEQRSFLALERNAQAFGGETGAPRGELATEILNPDGSAAEPRQSGFERSAHRGSEPLVNRSWLDRAPALAARAGARRRRDAHVPPRAPSAKASRPHNTSCDCFRSLIVPSSRRTSCASSDGRKPRGRRAIGVPESSHTRRTAVGGT